MYESNQQTDPYDKEWNARAYLQQYYSTPYVPDDTQAVLRFLTEQLFNRPNGYETAIDFGCGPTLYTAIAIAPYVQEIHLADYVAENLWEVRQWLEHKPGAHDWAVYLRWIAELQIGSPPSVDQLIARADELRRKVVGLHQCNIRQVIPLGEPRTFDLVVSCFCIEAVSTNRTDWARFLGNLSNLVADDGNLILAAVRHCSGYEVLGKRFPAVFLDENDFTDILPQLGFDLDSMIVRTVPITEWTDEGFDSICLVSAQKKRDAFQNG